MFKEKIRTHLDLLSIPRLWGGKCQNVCCDASTFTEHENHQTSNLNMKYSGEHNKKKQCPDHRQTFAANSCVCVFFSHFILDVRFVGSTSRGQTGFFIDRPSAVRAFIFLARRIQPFLSLVDRKVELRKNPSYRDSNSRLNVSEGYEVTN